MADHPHFSNYKSISEAVVGFGQLARINGLNVGIPETMEAMQAVRYGVVDHLDTLNYALKAIYCCTEEDTATFEKIFDWFWRHEKAALKSKTTYKNRSNLRKKTAGSLVMLGQGKQEEGKEASKNVSGANEVERLRKTDFSKLNELDSQLLEEIAMKLWKQMSLRLKRKMKASRTRGQIDLRQTIRGNISHGGELLELKHKNRKARKQRLIVLLDVSGSMDKYSFFLLRFLVALGAHFEKIEAFIFSTNLIHITPFLRSKSLETTLTLLSAKADNWSSGTKIGACFYEFNENYAKQLLNGYSTVIVLSDGLDTGSPEVLAAELRKIKGRTRQLIWLNPLKGMKGYAPVQRGMRVALPELDVFRSAHNLDSILELEKFLHYV